MAERKESIEKKVTADKKTQQKNLKPTCIGDLSAEAQAFFLGKGFLLTDSINGVKAGTIVIPDQGGDLEEIEEYDDKIPIFVTIASSKPTILQELLDCHDFDLEQTCLLNFDNFPDAMRVHMEDNKFLQTPLAFLLLGVGASAEKNIVDPRIDMMTRVIQKGPKINYTMPGYSTVLFQALLFHTALTGENSCLLEHHSLRILKQLLDSKQRPDINIRDLRHETPLFAIRYYQVEARSALSILCQRGADIDVTLPNKDTPLHRMTRFGFANHDDIAEEAEEVIYSADTLRAYIEAGVKVDALNQEGKTALWYLEHCVLHSRDVENLVARVYAKFFLQNATELFRVAATDDIRTAESLLVSGAAVTQRNARGQTPLHIACAAKQPVMALFLLKNGASPVISDDQGIAPLELMDVDLCKAMFQLKTQYELLTVRDRFNKRQTLLDIAEERCHPAIRTIVRYAVIFDIYRRMIDFRLYQNKSDGSLAATLIEIPVDMLESIIFPMMGPEIYATEKKSQAIVGRALACANKSEVIKKILARHIEYANEQSLKIPRSMPSLNEHSYSHSHSLEAPFSMLPLQLNVLTAAPLSPIVTFSARTLMKRPKGQNRKDFGPGSSIFEVSEAQKGDKKPRDEKKSKI